MKMPPWSYSSLTAFETCPRQYKHVKILKDVTEIKHEATTWGSTVHKHLEDRARDGVPLPASIAHYEPIVAPIIDSKGQKIIEQQFALAADMKTTTWMADNAWCRGIVDIGVLTRKSALLLDFKTGKRKTDSTQLKLFAGLAFAHYPDIRTVYTGFLWLKAGKVDKQRFERDDIPMIWAEFLPRVKRMERAFAEDKFPPKPSGLCGKWCPVPRYKCEFSGKQE
jgi:hypothetical protein